ncbi:hypothetical protein BX661DRAFT_175989 [Kickxella alabastrina]|uniref:uncharacterized protein n=1 Tax=Kickxella alabastrina TaxID=61397 RepID=UPI002220C001|nr:uncharacterized protein BX661DRAFT_175989 [Kickxella alabastrina]KAI7835040.1 hypothetical protein BX661DRAFT_175989 [Kickxella alabastrina]KAJ1947668.1 hypothetical protein GGF37_000251 [Kickxella alabastrina]
MRALLTIAIAATIASVASHPIGTRSLAGLNHVNRSLQRRHDITVSDLPLKEGETHHVEHASGPSSDLRPSPDSDSRPSFKEQDFKPFEEQRPLYLPLQQQKPSEAAGKNASDQDHSQVNRRPEDSQSTEKNRGNGNGNGGERNADGTPIRQHFEVVEHSRDNPNNVSRLSHTIVNDNANRVHSNIIQRVSIGDNNVVGQLNNNLVVQGVHGVVVTGTGNIIGNKENGQDNKKDDGKKDDGKKGADNSKDSQPVPKSP